MQDAASRNTESHRYLDVGHYIAFDPVASYEYRAARGYP